MKPTKKLPEPPPFVPPPLAQPRWPERISPGGRHLAGPAYAHIGAASLNQTVGDWKGNVARTLQVVLAARRRGVRVLLLPEMCLPGYSLGDRLARPATLWRSWDALREVAPHTEGMVVCLGLPILFQGVTYNAMAVVANGHIAGLVAKQNLATGDVEYENRWYQAWPQGYTTLFEAPDGTTVPLGNLVFDLDGLGVMAIEICEDGWKGIRPGSVYALSGAELLLNPSASWFTIGKHQTRRALVEQVSREDHCAYIYTSLLGCDATRLIFDGSIIVALQGHVVAEGRRFLFTEDWDLVDAVLDLSEVRQARLEEGSWREQVRKLQRGELGSMPTVIHIPGDFSATRPPEPPLPYWQVGLSVPAFDPSLRHLIDSGALPEKTRVEDLPHLELELALCLGLYDYYRKTGIRGFALALSGGRDSAMVAVLVHRAFRYVNPGMAGDELRRLMADKLVTAYLASDNSGRETLEAARAVAAELGATFLEGAIQPAVDAFVAQARAMMGEELSWSNAAHDIALQNVQARTRGVLIWVVANLRNLLLLTTSNKSEAAVGYCTMDGDTCGGLAPIADVPKSLIRLWMYWAQKFHGYSALAVVNGLTPTAELRPPDRHQSDEEDLMPFEVLDQLLYAFVQRAHDPVEIFGLLWPRFRQHYGGDPRRFAADIRRFVRMLCFAQWKRERFAISLRVTSFDLDPKTGFRFPPVQTPFDRELEDLDAHVARLQAGNGL
ncbi:MAG: NAD(+) synthase [Candidatus Schekmanbacteria bacterium]|nr:NAD(+) synthase [Candidatus Schekmanbacteria bacterium]